MSAIPSPRSAQRRPFLIALAVLALVVIAALFLVGGPGPMAFSKGHKVDLQDYHAANPSGVPAALAQASLIKSSMAADFTKFALSFLSSEASRRQSRAG